MSTERDQILASISEISLNGYITRKLDFLGTVHVYGAHYFNVFRRYNSVYEIVLEDMHGDLHFHKDYTVHQSLQRILCLSDEDMRTIHVRHVSSFKHGSYPTDGADAIGMRWSQIHARWQGMALDVGGILEDYPHEVQIKDENLVVEGSPYVHPEDHGNSPIASPLPSTVAVPSMPSRPSRRLNVVLQNGSADVLLRFQTAQSLSDRFAEVENKKRTWTQLSESEDEDEDEDEAESESESEDEENDDEEESESESEDEEIDKEVERWIKKHSKPDYLVLRNGTKVQRA